VALAYLDSELLASPSLEGGSPPLSTSESLESLTGREEEIGSMAGRERQATTACPIPSQTMCRFRVEMSLHIARLV